MSLIKSRAISAYLGQDSTLDLAPSLSKLSQQTKILDRDIVISRIATAIKTGEQIVLASDYDVDGICSSCILTEVIRTIGGRVTPVVATRFDGGYGFSTELMNRCLAHNPSLVITCDFGSADHDRLQVLKDKGIDSLVIDHHLVPDRPLPSLGLLNPHRPECPSDFKWMCSAGLAWSVAGGLLKELGLLKEVDITQWLDLAALATVADVMPLTGDNRTIVSKGLEVLSKAKRPGIRELMRIAKLTPGSKLVGRDLGFKFGPNLNAPGRLGPPDIIVDLLLSKDSDECARLGKQVEELAEKRRLITQVITDEAIEQITKNGYASHKALVLGDSHWGHGIVGIVAARLVDRYHVPVVVIGHEGRGSLRGPPGSKLYDALVYSKDHLVKYGGHQAAAGCQINLIKLDDLRKSFCHFFEENPPTPQEEIISNVIQLDLRDNLLTICDDIDLLEPCGQGNPRPQIKVEGKVKSAKEVKGGHLKLDILLDNGKTLGCFGINLGSEVDRLLSCDEKVSVIGDLRKNEWRGKVTAEILISNLS